MNIEFLMAARSRIVYRGQQSLIGALLGKPDDDGIVNAIESAEEKFRGQSNKTPLDALELLIADTVDAGETLIITNPEGYAAAQWLSQGDLATLPNPIPRAFVLYLAQAWANAGKYPTLKAALTDILKTKTFQ